VLSIGDFPAQLHSINMRGSDAATPESLPAKKERIVTIMEMERSAILGAIERLDGDKLMAAQQLGIGKTTLYRKLKEYGITEFPDASLMAANRKGITSAFAA
jgi:two-component system response regulator HydG